MGIKDFTKVFKHTRDFTAKDYKGVTIVFDLSIEVNRAILAMKSMHTLTDGDGKNTAHINTILLGVILKTKRLGANQIWVLDNGVTKLKEAEVTKRRNKRLQARVNLEYAIKAYASALECDDTKEVDACKLLIDKQEKRAATIQQYHIDDLVYILNMLDIPWIECLPEMEAEQLCAMLTYDIRLPHADFVWSSDTDAIAFGAKKVIQRKRNKSLVLYDLQTIQATYGLTYTDLVKVCVILGTDFAPKTPRIGPKTVMKRYEDIELTDAQQAAYDLFTYQLTDREVSSLVMHNKDATPFSDEYKYTELLQWLEDVKGFNRDRVVKAFTKACTLKSCD